MSDISERLAAALADRYTIERELGQGGMATVYLADDLKHHRRVAIKVLRPELAATLGPRRFMQEIEIAARLQHPHILPVHDSGEAAGFLFYVMPYVEGESLRERLTKHGELPVHDAVRLLIEVADGLAYAHAHGVVHRDIKPENIMVSGRHALVMDFGVAKAVSEASGRNKLTTAGVALGTPAYMAPEQASADPNLDQRVDIYALGVLGYELLSGRPPFTGGTPQQVLAAHVTEQPVPLTSRRATVSPPLASVIMKALEKRPADRWQTADELLMQLEPLATPSGGVTPAETRPTSAVAIRKSKLVPTLVVIGAVGVALVATALWRLHGSAPPPVSYHPVQVTSSGDANSPIVSPDGKELVYTSRTCAADGRCDERLVLFDFQTGARQVLADSLDLVQPIAWSSDGAWLLLRARGGARGAGEGAYVLSHLGGAMVGLGGSSVFVPGSDTALATPREVTGRHTAYLRRFVAPWSQPVDSVGITPPGDPTVGGIGPLAVSPSGRWLAAGWGVFTLTRWFLYIYDRRGHAADSLRINSMFFDRHHHLASIAWSASGRSLFVGVTAANGEAGLRRITVDPATGHFGRSDTLMLGTSAAAPTFGLSADRSVLAYTIAQAGERVLWTLSAPRPGVFPRPARRVRSASQDFTAGITPDGSTILFTTTTTTATGTATEIVAEPFGGGAAETVTPPLKRILASTLTTDGRRLIVAAPLAGDRATLTAYPLYGGQPSSLGVVADTGLSMANAGRDGVAIVNHRGDSVTILDGAGQVAHRFAVPDSLRPLDRWWPSPDGRAFVAMRTLRAFSTTMDHDGNLHVPLYRMTIEGAIDPVATVKFDYAIGMHWLSDGTLWFIATDHAYPRLAIYRIPITGGTERRGEPLPFPDGCQCELSADGRRGTAVVTKPISDVWVVRNFRGIGTH